MTLETQFIGETAVIELRGKMTLGEGDDMLKEAVASLLAQGCKQFVINLEHVPYVDSSGNGELVRSFTKITKSGGRLIFVHPSVRIANLLSTTRLLDVYSVVPSIRDALDQLHEHHYLECPCPVCHTPVRFAIGRAYAMQVCGSCTSGFRIDPIETPADRGVTTEMRVKSIRIPTYENEWVDVDTGDASRISLPPRLDLFAWEVVKKGWDLLSSPRDIIVDVGRVRHFTTTAVEILLERCRRGGDRVKFAVTSADAPLKNELSARGIVWTLFKLGDSETYGWFGFADRVAQMVSFRSGVPIMVPVRRPE